MVLPAKLLDHFLWSNKSNINPMYVQHVFSVLFTRVLNTIACVCRRGVSGLFSAGLWLAFVSSVRDSFGHGKCLPIFNRGLCMCCVCVCTHTHTHCMWGTQMWARVSGRDTWRARKKYRCTVVIVYIHTVWFTKYTCTYICWPTGRSLNQLLTVFAWLFGICNSKKTQHVTPHFWNSQASTCCHQGFWLNREFTWLSEWNFESNL